MYFSSVGHDNGNVFGGVDGVLNEAFKKCQLYTLSNGVWDGKFDHLVLLVCVLWVFISIWLHSVRREIHIVWKQMLIDALLWPTKLVEMSVGMLVRSLTEVL